jgi:CubicO group peptidase (beta-lactamase class C family)
MRGHWLAALLAAFSGATIAQAQVIIATPSAYQRSIAAGYKAIFLCGGIFLAGRTEAQIESLELTGIYPEYDRIMPTLKANVDRARGMVSVSFIDTLPPRRAEYRKGRGCMLVPVGATPPLPSEPREAPPPPAGRDLRAWPVGDTTGVIRVAGPVAVQMNRAFDGESFGKGTRTTALVVVRDGRIVAERYADGFGPHVSQRTWSVAKSITGTLAGIVEGEGLVRTSEPARVPFWAWQPGYDPRRRITLDNLLRMASGLHTIGPGNRADDVYFGGGTVDGGPSAALIEAAPGTRFNYSNDDIMLAMLTLRTALGEERYRDFPMTALFAKLDMRNTFAETDWRGNYVLSSQVWTTARDLARLGMFWLDDGVWRGTRILPPHWMRYATTPSGPQAPRGLKYGATMWLLDGTPGLPPGSYAAIGNRGQFVIVIPAHRTVIVRRGEDPYATNFDGARLAVDMLAALK